MYFIAGFEARFSVNLIIHQLKRIGCSRTKKKGTPTKLEIKLMIVTQLLSFHTSKSRMNPDEMRFNPDALQNSPKLNAKN